MSGGDGLLECTGRLAAPARMGSGETRGMVGVPEEIKDNIPACVAWRCYVAHVLIKAQCTSKPGQELGLIRQILLTIHPSLICEHL